jgi:hypothetical protein
MPKSHDVFGSAIVATIATVTSALLAIVAVKILFKGQMESRVGLAIWLIPLIVPFLPVWKLTIGTRMVIALAACLLTLVLGLILVAVVFGEAP